MSAMLFPIREPEPTAGVILECFVAGVPRTAGSKRGFVNPKTGRVIITDSVNTKGGGADWRSDIRAAVRDHHHGPALEGLFRLDLIFQRVRPKNQLTSKGRLKPDAPSHPGAKPDVGKLARAVEDALTGVLYVDDARLVEVHLYKVYADSPGCLIRLSRV